MFLAEKYANFSGSLAWGDLPPDVRKKTLDLLADWIANGAAGFHSKIGRALSGVFPEGPSNGKAVLLGTLQQTAPLEAALINGGACHSLEFDDAYRGGLFHPGAPVISAAWAASGIKEISGPRFLTAIAAGYEISMRLAEAVNPGHNQIWHTTGTVGTFGAAASASHCLGLDSVQTANAFGLAGTQASGLWEILPDSPLSKGLHTGKAAQSGLLAALLSGQGISGPSTIFEGARGFFKAMVPEDVNMEACCAGLGDEWRLSQTTIKAYPVCGHTMTSIEAALKLGRNVNPDRIEKIEIRAHSVSMGIAGNMAPRTELEAKFSIAFCVAVALTQKKVTLVNFSPDILSDPVVLSLLSKTTMITDDELGNVKGQRPARITLTFNDGSTCSETAYTRKGDPENPLTRAEIKNKFMGLVDGIWGAKMGESIFHAISLLPDYENFNTWIRDNILPWQKK